MNTPTKAFLASGLIACLATCLQAGEIVVQPYRTGTERRLDNPVDAWMNAWPGVAGVGVAAPDKTDPRRFEILSDDSKNGDFSVTFTVEKPDQKSAFGYTCGKYIDRWEVGDGASLHLWLKLAAPASKEPMELALYDNTGKRTSFQLDTVSGNSKWREFDVPLKKFAPQDGFNFKAVRAVQVEATLPKDARIWLDDIYFHEGDAHIGVSDKTITQIMAEVRATRARRAEVAAQAWQDPAWAAFCRGNVEEGNRRLKEHLDTWMDKATAEKTGHNIYNPLFGKPMMSYYMALSSKGTYKPGSLSPENEKRLLEAMKVNDLLVNDIAIPRHGNTWYIVASENHDYNKIKAMLYSQIFMNLPQYADQVYPDKGTNLDFDRYLDVLDVKGQTTSLATTGSGKYKDGKSYKASDHFREWVRYFKEYMAERARCGFFNEQNADGEYGRCAAFYFNWIYTWAQDKELHEQSKMFLDLMYAKWLQDQMNLLQGGAASRGSISGGSVWAIVEFLMGGDCTSHLDVPLSDYEWPRVLWEMALNRKGRGEYAYVSRVPHEEQDLNPRPEGTDTVMLWRRDSRIARSSWVTPDYVLGVRLDDPNALYTHILGASTGVSFPTSPDANVKLNVGRITRTVQDRGVALMQQKHYVSIQHPPQFPSYVDTQPTPGSFTIGKDVDQVEEQDGWIFIQEGDAYGAFRFVNSVGFELIGRDERGYGLLKLAKDTYVLEKNEKGETKVTAKEPMIPLVVEMSRKAHYATLADFKKAVLANPLTLTMQSARFGKFLTYKGCGKEAKELHLNLINDEVPRIDGKYITYDVPAFDSPWVKGAFDSGVVTLTGPISGEKLVYDFNQRSPRVVADR